MAGVVNNCKECGFLIFDEQTIQMLCDQCLRRHEREGRDVPVNPLAVSDALLCNHANEVPVECICGSNCYCRTQGSCRVKQVKNPRKKRKVKKKYRYLGRFDNLNVENDGTGD